MAFTYVGDLSTDRDKFRFYAGDTRVNSGVRPNKRNFSDAEADGLISLAGTWQEAVREAFKSLAAEWAVFATSAVGPRRHELGKIADQYRKLIESWRPPGDLGVSTMIPERTDGYADEADTDAPEYTYEICL